MSKRQADMQVIGELDHMWTALLTDMSGELRTPLTSIKGFASSLLQPDVQWTDAQRVDFLNAIAREADRMDRLITRLLDVSYLEDGETRLKKEHCRLEDIVEGISRKLAFITRHHNLELSVPADLPPVLADRERIAQLLTILVENAARHSKDGLPILMKAISIDSVILVAVTDESIHGGNGNGGYHIQSRQIDNINGTRRVRTSLELPVCQAIVEAHGGRIWVESALGQGSRFCFTLPVSRNGHGNGNNGNGSEGV